MSGSIARNIVSQLGDLYMDFTHPATAARVEFVKYRQATNDQADAFVEALLREYTTGALEAAAKAVEVPMSCTANRSCHQADARTIRACAARLTTTTEEPTT